MLYAAFFNVMPPRFEGVFYYFYESPPRERVRKRTLCSLFVIRLMAELLQKNLKNNIFLLKVINVGVKMNTTFKKVFCKSNFAKLGG